MEINFTSDVLKKWGAIALIVFVFAGGVYYLGISGVFDRLFSNDLPESEVEAGGIAAAQGVEAETSYFVYVSNEEGEWKFGRILFEQEAEKYTEEGVQ